MTTPRDLGSGVCIYCLRVLDPPRPPYITGNDVAYVEVGTMQRISCSAIGGNPAPTLTWYKGTRKVTFHTAALKKVRRSIGFSTRCSAEKNYHFVSFQNLSERCKITRTLRNEPAYLK